MGLVGIEPLGCVSTKAIAFAKNSPKNLFIPSVTVGFAILPRCYIIWIKTLISAYLPTSTKKFFHNVLGPFKKRFTATPPQKFNKHQISWPPMNQKSSKKLRSSQRS